jgi:transglutaminase-like putative cysteine protease
VSATVAGAVPAARAAAAPRDSLVLRLVAFAALALFGAAHWSTLVQGSAAWRTWLVVAVGTAGAAALGSLGRLAGPDASRRVRWLIQLGAVAVAIVTFLLALVAAGLEARLLFPAHWAELFDGLDRGLAGAQVVEWPYPGSDEWISLSILLGAPLLVTLAALLAFWPVRRAAGLWRALGLGTLLILYGLPATEYDSGAPLMRGLALLVLVAAWLWLPRLDRRDAGVAAAVVAAVGIAALPAAAALDADRPWWDYGGVSWFGDGKRVAFDWTHQYGPLDWPRDGTTLLNVQSDRPHYWKTESLDVFDGFRWARSPADDDGGSGGADIPLRAPDDNRRWDYFERNPAWDAHARFTIRSLSTDLVVGLGTVYSVQGVEGTESSGDGTIRTREPLEKGDSYEVAAYAPDPSAAQMRGAPRGYPGELAASTQVFLPRPGENALEGDGLQGDAGRSAEMNARPVAAVPLREGGYGDGGRSAHQLLASPYARVYQLATSLTQDQATAYDAVKSVENYLQANYTYSERPPSQEFPLAAFLFEDRIGYCQQFSGAMALMLRMSGIPARVAAGFSPGSYNKDEGEYRVRDLDAHSWVEVYFTGIGWVPFDPTPSAAPAESQSTGVAATSAARADGDEVRLRGGERTAATERGSDTGAKPAAHEGGASWWLWPLGGVLAVLLGGAALLTLRSLRVRRRLAPGELADAQLAELRPALERLGWNLPENTTLLDLERRLGRLAGPASARYAAELRAHRYDPHAPAAPTLSERRALRRELTAHGGVRARLRGLIALPPGGPRTA